MLPCHESLLRPPLHRAWSTWSSISGFSPGQAEAELPLLSALVGEKAVEGVHEHARNQLPHGQNSMGLVSSGDRACWATCLFGGRSADAGAASVAGRLCFRRHCPRKSSALSQLAGCAVRYQGVYSPPSIAAMPPVSLVGLSWA
jgi:hypothetical protein